MSYYTWIRFNTGCGRGVVAAGLATACGLSGRVRCNLKIWNLKGPSKLEGKFVNVFFILLSQKEKRLQPVFFSTCRRFLLIFSAKLSAKMANNFVHY